MVPESAIAYRGEVTGVYVIDKSGMPSLRQIRLGRPSISNKIQVLAGLDEGEVIATDPVHAAIYLKQQQEKQQGDQHE